MRRGKWPCAIEGIPRDAAQPFDLDLAGVVVTPHVQSTVLRYRREPDHSLGARVQLFLRNAGTSDLIVAPAGDIPSRGRSPEELLAADESAWHDLPSAWPELPLHVPPGALTVWSFNGKQRALGCGNLRPADGGKPADGSGNGPAEGLALRGELPGGNRPIRSLTRSSFMWPTKGPPPCASRPASFGCPRAGTSGGRCGHNRG